MIDDVVEFLRDPPDRYVGSQSLDSLVLQHLGFSVSATLIAMAIALPLGLWVGHRGRGELLVVQLTNTGRAIPDFGIILLAVMVLSLGVAPVIITLAALAVPPILINTYVGVRQVDPDLRDAAYGVGMTGWQVLRQLEIPLAIPLVMTGVRTAAVQVVATATLAGAIGGGGLGRLIFDGLAVGLTAARGRIIVACIIVAILALATEGLLALLQRALTPRGLRGGPDAAEDALEVEPDQPAMSRAAA